MMNKIMMRFAGTIAKIIKFIEEHTIASIIIFVLISSYFVPILYVSNIVRWFVGAIMGEKLISFGK